MKSSFFLVLLMSLMSCKAQRVDVSQKVFGPDYSVKYNDLTEWEQQVMLRGGTDPAFTGNYHEMKVAGVYLCKRCNNPLYSSSDKFDSGTGWPSFDDVLDEGVILQPDTRSSATEIICANCKGHLGHIFYGEGFTKKNVRHCINESALQFFTEDKKNNLPEVIRSK